MAFKSTKGSGNVWNPKKDSDGNERVEAKPSDFLDGFYVDRRDGVGEFNSSVFTFRNKETDEETDVWGDTVLTSELDKIRLGKYVRVQWHGKKFKKAFQNAKTFTQTNSFHDWEVFVDDDVKPLEINGESSTKQNTAQATSGNGAGKEQVAGKGAAGSTAGQTFTASSQDDDLPF